VVHIGSRGNDCDPAELRASRLLTVLLRALSGVVIGRGGVKFVDFVNDVREEEQGRAEALARSDSRSDSETDDAVPVESPVLRPVLPWVGLDRSLPQFDGDSPIHRVTSLAGDGAAVFEIIVSPFPIDVEVVAIAGLCPPIPDLLQTRPYGETVFADSVWELITDARRCARRTRALVFHPGEEGLDFELLGCASCPMCQAPLGHGCGSIRCDRRQSQSWMCAAKPSLYG
jgi:hypothetical protein